MADVVEAMKTEKKSGTSLRIDGCVVILSMEITPKKIKNIVSDAVKTVSAAYHSKSKTNTQTEGLILRKKKNSKENGDHVPTGYCNIIIMISPL